MFGQGRRRHAAGMLYSLIVAEARQPEFYSAMCVPDTIEGRFELVILHCSLVLRRLGRIGGPAARLGQELLQYMLDDLDRSIREIGVGDMVIGKYMKRLGKSFYGRANAYDLALDGSDADALRGAVRRNILGTSEASDVEVDIAAEALALYVLVLATKLDGCDLAAIEAGAFRTQALERQAA